jgi:hypothetical protein
VIGLSINWALGTLVKWDSLVVCSSILQEK